jgi:hypothetical protein
MSNMDTRHDTLLPRVRQSISIAASKLARATPQEQTRLLAEAQAVFNSLPPGYQNMARDMIQRESARGVTPRSLGGGGAAATGVSTAANIAAIIGVVGQIGLAVYQTTEARRDSKDAQRRAAKEQEMMQQLQTAQLEAMREERERRAAESEAAIEAMRSGGMSPDGTPAPDGGGNTKTLLIAGGVAAAAVAAMALSK